jgi:serine protease Do
MMLPKKVSKLFSISALAILPFIGSHAVNAQDVQTMPVPPIGRGSAQTFSMFVGGESFLGVQTENVTRENFAKYNLSEPRGVVVSKVTQNSLAAKAGLRDGDVIVRFEGEDVKSVSKLQRLIQEVAPDQKARVTVLRSGGEQEITVTMGKRPEPQFRSFGDFPQGGQPFNLPPMQSLPRMENLPQGEFKFEVPNGENVFVFPGTAGRRLGVSVTPLNKQLGDYFGVSDGKGLLVENVVESSAAAKAGLKAGDVIVEVEGKAVSRQADLLRALSNEGEITLTIVRDRQRQTVRVTPETNKPTAAPGATRKF